MAWAIQPMPKPRNLQATKTLASAAPSRHSGAMTEKIDPADIPDMATLRLHIDALDAELLALLGQRTRLVERAAQIKQGVGWPARIPARVEEVVANARRLAEAEGVDPEMIEPMWRLMIEHFIALEDRHLKGSE